jgi:heat shock protein HslJ
MKQTAKFPYLAVALIAIAVLAACGTDNGSGNGGGDGGDGGDGADVEAAVTGVRWVPESVTVEGTTYRPPASTEAHVEFKPGEKQGAGGNSGGSGGCNGFGADVAVDGDTIKISDMAWTEMGCGDEINQFETQFFTALNGEHRAEVSEDGTVLTLTKDNGDGLTLKGS